jgi:hypothetical protein
MPEMKAQLFIYGNASPLLRFMANIWLLDRAALVQMASDGNESGELAVLMGIKGR